MCYFLEFESSFPDKNHAYTVKVMFSINNKILCGKNSVFQSEIMFLQVKIMFSNQKLSFFVIKIMFFSQK